MRRIIPTFVGLLILTACSGDRPLSKSAFTDEFATRLRQAAPTLKVEIKAEPELKLTTSAGHDSIAYLDNSYTAYRASPKDREAIFAQYIGGTIEAGNVSAKDTPLDQSMITPVIKHRAWLTEIISSTKGHGLGDKPVEFVYEPLNAELVIAYAEDSPKTLSYLTPTRLQTTGLKMTDLRKLAVENLKRMLTQVEAKGGNGIYLMTAGGTYEASLLLFDDIWQEKKLKVEGDYVVAVPSRDMLLITGSENKEGIKKVRELAKGTVAEASYRLRADLFVYRDGRFVRFDD